MRALLVLTLALFALTGMAQATDGGRKLLHKFVKAANDFDANRAASLIADDAVITIAKPGAVCMALNKTAYVAELVKDFTMLATLHMSITSYRQHGTAFAAELSEEYITNSFKGQQYGGIITPFLKGHVNADGSQFADLDILVGSDNATKQATFFNDVLNTMCSGAVSDIQQYFTANATVEQCTPGPDTSCRTIPVTQYVTEMGPWFANRTQCEFKVFSHGASCGYNAGRVSDFWVGQPGEQGVASGFHLFRTHKGPSGAVQASSWHMFLEFGGTPRH